jgi:hypothetical protein
VKKVPASKRNSLIENIKNIVFVNYLGEACGVDGGGIYFSKWKMN